MGPDWWESGEPADSYRHHREARVRLRALPAPWWKRMLWRTPDWVLIAGMLVAMLLLAVLVRWAVSA